MKLLRAAIYAELEAEWLMFDNKSGVQAREKLAAASKTYIQTTAPREYVDALVPKFEVGCKRRVFDTGYLACLWKQNIELVHNDPVERLSKDSVIFRSGRELKIDAVVLATGFKTTKLLSNLNIIGRGGVSIHDHVSWASLPNLPRNTTDKQQWRHFNLGLPQAYYGTCVAGFPNFFMLMGPNTVTGHLSVIFSTECQINFTLNMLDPILRSRKSRASRAISAVEVTQSAEDDENKWIQDKAKTLVWSSGCTNWYVEPKSGKNVMVYPEWQWHFWLRSFVIDYSKFVYTRRNGERAQTGRGLWQLFAAGLLVILATVHIL